MKRIMMLCCVVLLLCPIVAFARQFGEAQKRVPPSGDAFYQYRFKGLDMYFAVNIEEIIVCFIKIISIIRFNYFNLIIFWPFFSPFAEMSLRA